MIDPIEFLEITSGGNVRDSPTFKIGAIAAGPTSNNKPPVQFDGETTASTKGYGYLASYTPSVGDRVLLAAVGRGFVIIGKIM